ncbi:MAG: hut operon positive regulator HutP [Clostridiales bacterium]|mgnify:FL=1|jgi:hypothetical protein|nr:hut operon positive regulator HutP [Clostridiales bacterium]
MAENITIGTSAEIAAAAIRLALTFDREGERALRTAFLEKGYRTAAVDFGGEFIPSINKIIERAVVAAKREGVIDGSHLEEGAVAGAAREAVSQIINKAIGLNVGGKIGIARTEDHVSVAMFFRIGLLHLNEVAIGLGHRAL